MKAQLAIGDDWKQIILTPETDHDKTVCEMLSTTAAQNVEVNFGGYYLERCRGGWYRQYEQGNALMFTLTPRVIPMQPDAPEFP